jgi:hypothetical protein
MSGGGAIVVFMSTKSRAVGYLHHGTAAMRARFPGVCFLALRRNFHMIAYAAGLEADVSSRRPSDERQAINRLMEARSSVRRRNCFKVGASK